MNKADIEARQKLIFDYLDLPMGSRWGKGRRPELKGFLKENGISRKIFYEVKALHELGVKQALAEKNKESAEDEKWRKRVRMVGRLETMKEGESAEVNQVLDKLYDQCIKDNNWNACREYLKATGNYIEKSEQKVSVIEFSADEYLKARAEAQQLVDEHLKSLRQREDVRDGSVCTQPALLSEQVCLHPE